MVLGDFFGGGGMGSGDASDVSTYSTFHAGKLNCTRATTSRLEDVVGRLLQQQEERTETKTKTTNGYTRKKETEQRKKKEEERSIDRDSNGGHFG
jgi:hypothetical protein